MNTNKKMSGGVAVGTGISDPKPSRLYTISEVAEELGRVPHTLRVWGYHNRLPVDLQPSRTARGWRVWTREQIDGLKKWIIEEDMTPGKGLRKKP